MKRLISIICILFLTFSSVSAEISEGDLNQLKQAFDQASYDELMVLYNFLTSYIMSRSEWKEVSVPAGTWIVGEDIPAGTYSIKSTSVSCVVDITDKDDGFILYNGIFQNESIGKIELKDGYKIRLSGSVIFAPPALLGF